MGIQNLGKFLIYYFTIMEYNVCDNFRKVKNLTSLVTWKFYVNINFNFKLKM